MKRKIIIAGYGGGSPGRLQERSRTLSGPGPALLILMVAVTVVFPTFAVTASGQEKLLHTYPALLGVEIQITADGSLQFLDQTTDQLILKCGFPAVPLSRANPSRYGDVFSARAPEGIQGGRRGEPGRADDDGDGRIDEDPLDGRDNDGDGRVDEDFAAISDAMVVVDSDGGARRAEFYHWAYSHLMSAAFFSLSGEADPARISDYRFEAPGGLWSEAEVYSRRHSLGGRPVLSRCTAQVAQVNLQGVPGAGLWVGVMVLETGSGPSAPARIVADGDRLELLQVGPEGETSVVACVAESWLQLNRLLCESRRVYEGVLDPVTGIQTPWVVPPLCPLCRQAGNPEFSWSLEGEEDLLLNIEIKNGKTGLADPDLFALGGTPLGFPVEIIWKPEGGVVQRERWTRMTPGLLIDPVKGLSDPFGEFTDLLGHEAAGKLTFRFMIPEADPAWGDPYGSGSELSDPQQLNGRWLDGRPLGAPAVRISGPTPAQEQDPSSGKDKDRGSGSLSLSPELLQGWPNPFREAIQVRFKIPQTQSEAFAWGEGHDLSSEMKMRAPVSWESGAPFVTVKIYRINGQELVTLHQDYSISGETTVQWDGTDSFGRPVASGPYFCKLQMDDWSVTQRIVFLR